MDRIVSRKCDMGSGLKLKVHLQDDGDVIVSVLPVNHKFSNDSVEFCSSGTQSPRTQKALRQLYKAMAEDESERPQEV